MKLTLLRNSVPKPSSDPGDAQYSGHADKKMDQKVICCSSYCGGREGRKQGTKEAGKEARKQGFLLVPSCPVDSRKDWFCFLLSELSELSPGFPPGSD